MADSKQLPVLQGYWRLLDKDEPVMAGDEMWQMYQFVPVLHSMIGKPLLIDWYPIRRRVPPPPTCGTCEYFDPKLKYFTDICGHGEGLHSCNPDGSDYCSKHPQAQEVTR